MCRQDWLNVSVCGPYWNEAVGAGKSVQASASVVRPGGAAGRGGEGKGSVGVEGDRTASGW